MAAGLPLKFLCEIWGECPGPCHSLHCDPTTERDAGWGQCKGECPKCHRPTCNDQSKCDICVRRRRNQLTRAPNKNRRKRPERTQTVEGDQAISWNDWRGQVRNQIDDLRRTLPIKPLDDVWQLARFSYVSWNNKHVMAHGVETNWPWLMEHARKNGKRSGNDLETEYDLESARYFLVVGDQRPELFAVASDLVYYHMSPHCALRYAGLQIAQKERRAVGKWYPYKTFIIADLDVQKVQRFPTAASSTSDCDAIVWKYQREVTKAFRQSTDAAMQLDDIEIFHGLCKNFWMEYLQAEQAEIFSDASQLVTDQSLLQRALQQLAGVETTNDAKQCIRQIHFVCRALLEQKQALGFMVS
eukprot:Skav217769  [mRNA]  locus=scaffold5469:21629:22699:- [translate_table: standard]